MKQILIDVFGCDNPSQVIEGVALALNNLPEISLVVCGDQNKINAVLQNCHYDKTRLEIVHAEQEITNHDKPLEAIRHKKKSSLVVALQTLAERNDIDVLITAGSTGSVILGASVLLGKRNRETRPTLVTALPADNGKFVCLADCGANVDCKPEHLLDFAMQTSAYAKDVYGLESPRVALLSVGTEDEKGDSRTKPAFQLLKQSNLNFVGNVEAKTVLSGNVDVVVADGFDGNVLLKCVEGTAKSVIGRTMALLQANAPQGTNLDFVKKSFAQLMQSIDFNTMGGAVLLGCNKPIIKAHGSATSQTVYHCVLQALNMIQSGFTAR